MIDVLNVSNNKRNYITCILNNRQRITIPKIIREKIDIRPKEEVIIAVKKGSKDLIIKKAISDVWENKMIISEKGCIRIPSEFIRVLGLKMGDQFLIDLNIKDSIIIKKINN